MERPATGVNDSFEQYDCDNEFVKGLNETDSVGLEVIKFDVNRCLGI